MVTCVPGHRLCGLGEHVGSVVPDELQRSGSSRLMNSILASCSIGSPRSVSTPSSAMATVRLASEGEMPLAISSRLSRWGNPDARRREGQSDHHDSCCSLAAYECR